METYNCRLLDYPEGQQVTFYKRSITRGKERKEKEKPLNENFSKAYKNEARTEEEEKHCLTVSLNATKNRIYNIARSNVWEWFITLTFDRERTDASEYSMIVKRLKIFLNHLQQRKCPDMKYLIVPELHKDRKNYHFHGLLADVNGMQFVYSGSDTEAGEPVYNLPQWTWGFTTATRIADSLRASSYITKYITKETESVIKEKRRYYCSRNINRTEPELFLKDEEEFLQMYVEDISYCKTAIVPKAHQACSYFELNK